MKKKNLKTGKRAPKLRRGKPARVQRVVRARTKEILHAYADSAGLGILEPIPSWMFDDSVEARNALQNCGRVHPYTCGNDRTDEAHREYQASHGGDFGQLVAVEDGWLCPVCGYTQKLRLHGVRVLPMLKNEVKTFMRHNRNAKLNY